MTKKKSFSKNFTTVTTFSKLLAASLFIILPMSTFILGLNFQEKIKDEVLINSESRENDPQKIQRESIQRCGDIPDEAKNVDGEYPKLTDAIWSPGCEFLIYRLKFGPLGMDYTPPPTDEQILKSGLYIYDAESRQTQKLKFESIYNAVIRMHKN